MTTRFPGFRQIVREFVPSVVRAIGGVLRPRRASRPVYRWARPERRAHAAPVVVGRDDHLRPSCAFLSVFLVVYAQAYMTSLGQVGDHHAAVYKLNAAAYSYHAVVLTFFVSDSVWRHVQSTKYACVQCLMSCRFKHFDRNVPVGANIYLCAIGMDRRTLLRLVLQAEHVWQTERAARDADLDVDCIIHWSVRCGTVRACFRLVPFVWSVTTPGQKKGKRTYAAPFFTYKYQAYSTIS